eukprot:12173872-Ditylum_brightwellii.AAC.1
MGNELLHHFKLETFPDGTTQTICNRQYLFGVVNECIEKSANMYKHGGEDSGDPLGSDYEVEDEEECGANFEDNSSDLPKIQISNTMLQTHIKSKTPGTTQKINGILWEKDGEMSEPINKSNYKGTSIK